MLRTAETSYAPEGFTTPAGPELTRLDQTSPAELSAMAVNSAQAKLDALNLATTGEVVQASTPEEVSRDVAAIGQCLASQVRPAELNY